MKAAFRKAGAEIVEVSMKERIEIPVSTRQTGKHFSRQSRGQGKVPAVIYGPKTEPINVLADEITLKKYSGHKFESSLFMLKSDDKKVDKTVIIIRDVQVHPVTRRPLHADFYAPDMTKPVRVNVEIRVEGKAAGLTEGGLLSHNLRELEIEVLPTDIPEFITADVSHLGLGDALHVSDLKVGKGVRVVSLPTLTVATVFVPREEAATPAAATAAPAAGAAAAPAAGAAAAPAAGGEKKK
jgi:large subunit ribosomal protein L25